MIPSHTCKGSRRYRYYVTKPDHFGNAPSDGWRIPAGEVDALVTKRLASWLGDGVSVVGHLEGQNRIDDRVTAAARIASELSSLKPSELRQMLLDLDVRLGIQADQVGITFTRARLVEKLGGKAAAGDDKRVIAITVEASFVRRGVEMKLRYSPKDIEAPPAYDVKLAELIAKAELAYASLIEDAESVAPESRPHLVRLARLKFLAPDIVTSIIDGRQPPDLTARTLMRTRPLPLCWDEQRALFGFA